MTLNEYKNKLDEISHNIWIFYDNTREMPYASKLFDAWHNLEGISTAISSLKTEIINEYKATNAD